MRLSNVLIGVAALLAALGGIGVQRHFSQSASIQMPVAALDLSLPDLQGRNQPISQWRGKVVVLNFWATWCPPCLREIPEFIRLQQRYGDQGLQLVGIAIDSHQAVTDYLKTIDINYPMLIAEGGGMELSRQLGNVIGAVPFTVIIDPQGQVVYRHPGELSAEKILQWLGDLNAKSAGSAKSAISR